MFFTKPANRSPAGWEGDVAVDSKPIAAQDELNTATAAAQPAGAPVEPSLDDEDQAQLEALGFQSDFRRDMSPWANFSLGFTYLSPVVGIYTVFAFALATAGPPMIWSLLIAGIGQMLVALVFSEVVAQFPVAGGVYPWARRLWGRKWAWMTGWVYMFTLLALLADAAYGAGPYVADVFGFKPSPHATVLCALIMLALATVINLTGTKILGYFAIFGFSAELIGAIVVGVWLLCTQRHHNLGVLFHSFGAEGKHSYTYAFLAASLIALYQFFGFEACGDVAEEVRNPGVQIPKAMRRTIYVGGSAATFVCLSLILSVTDFGAVISGKDRDPIDTILKTAFGGVGAKIVLCIVLISFVSCALSLQAAASRLIYSYGRDDMIVGSKLLARFDHKRHVPPYSLLIAVIIPAVLIVGSLISSDALTKLVSFGSVGVYIAFQMVVLAALRARIKGWVPKGKYRLGRWGVPVNIGALIYGVAAIVNLAWPRDSHQPWYDDYIILLMSVTIIALGILYLAFTRAHAKSDAPHADAIPEPARN
ncbi:amino acid permease [Mycobacterium parascrofulaceum ATCC BAA-614]|uniref:Amino acid permease n=1 Tax=Mycobacterium parascrofulaceum ATCC BAA-614 TaxID=525368 RepID=D5P3U2_9MYCO|nr:MULTISPECIES: APC family permease [Mycobacterium]EFG79251.1 amino acid permease [Mycobacterium parascrofulaceum ATCC BAA-614]OCB33618.1 amino acid permease [Mycobacterium malmoense]